MFLRHLGQTVSGRIAIVIDRWRQRRLAATFLTAAILSTAAVGAGVLVTFPATSPPSTSPRPEVTTGATTPPSTPPPSSPATPVSPSPTDSALPLPRNGLPRSEPVRVSIRNIGVAAQVIPVGVDAEARLEVPPLTSAHLTGWYRHGPTPGEIGNAVIVGHVDTRAGPAVFFRLNTLRPGDIITVTRKDRTTVQFTVDRVASYRKTAFPTALVYGPADQPSLRLVTCGGQFDAKARSYLDNIIVFATATSWHNG